MRYSELERLLRQAGCTICRQGASHAQWYSPKTGKIFPVGRHKSEDVKPGTLKAIKRDAGLE